mmetsp:Transcript_5382/g.5546  ORF Transcript_5382/g.5546 Transcript_5382/m.5546 type:complete len:414 (+) Transcript_5382:70-1311(+)
MMNIWICSIALVISHMGMGEKLDYLSFEPPFTDVDNSGTRMISRDWRISGSTSVNSNFVRLTPDKQSKKGAIWSRKSLGVPTFSIILKFRISGKGKVFFGDGVALWMVQQGYYTEGDLHGFPERFTGIGIIFDTFKNTEHISAHRDVTVLVNDGEKTYEMMTSEVQGCNANFRYHAERADFAVTDATRAKIIVEENNITISLDPKNTGEWTECVSLRNIALPQEWARRAHIGVTGTTGQLSDNHDVISMQTYSDYQVMEAHDAVQETKKKFEGGSDYPVRDRLQRVEDALNTVFDKMDFMDHHLEHKLVTLEEHVSSMQHKLDKLESIDPSQMDDKDSKISEALEKSLSKVDDKIADAIELKIQALEAALETKIRKLGISGWQLPFSILLLVVLGAAVALVLFYQRLKKMHML